MKHVFSVIRIRLLAGMIAAGTVLSAGVWLLFTEYTASFAISDTRPNFILSFKDAEATLQSLNALDRYVQARGVANNPEVKIFRNQMARGAAGPVKITQEWALSKVSMRNVPEEIISAIFKNPAAQAPGGAPTTTPTTPTWPSSIRISTSARTPEMAVKTAEFAGAFLRAVLVQRSLMKSIQDWRDTEASIADGDAKLLNMQRQLDSFDRLIAGMGELRDSPKGVASEAGLGGSSPVQVQVNGPTFLPAEQQLVALRSRRLTWIEDMQMHRDELDRVKAIHALGDQIQAIVNEEDDPITALAKAQTRSRQMREQAKSIPTQVAADAVVARLASLNADYVASPTNPVHAIASRTGIGLGTGIAIGVAIGGIGWMVIVGVLLMWKSEIQAFWREHLPQDS